MDARDAPGMGAADVVEIVQLLLQRQVEVYLDGGWGVDALLGEQTRWHADLDIAVRHKDVAQLRSLLAARGFAEVPQADSWECNFVLGDSRGRRVDVHSFTHDAAGNHIHGLAYPVASLSGTGAVNGVPVKCISPEWLVQFHTGYPLDKDDYRDVKALCQRFGLSLPAAYAPFEAQDRPVPPEA